MLARLGKKDLAEILRDDYVRILRAYDDKVTDWDWATAQIAYINSLATRLNLPLAFPSDPLDRRAL